MQIYMMQILKGLSEGQVLQRVRDRGATARLAGNCSENGAVSATVFGRGRPLKGWRERRVGVASAGVFSAVLEGVPPGGPYRLELRCGSALARMRVFYCGDVWLLAGQSNMEGVGNMDGAAKPHPLLRVFSMARRWRQARDPLHLPAESPDPCHSGGHIASRRLLSIIRRSARKGVGVGLFFARRMLEQSGVSQGLIAVAHGGTSMAQWDPGLKKNGGESLYGSMLRSLRSTGQPIAGVLWYQGESDTKGAAPDVYTARMSTLVAALRRDLRQPGLPWIMVQIGSVHGGWGGPRWNDIQELQRLLPSRIRNLETVSAIDFPLDDNIHIGAAGFPRLAARLARAAARLAYGDLRESPMPRLRDILPPGGRGAASHIDVVYEHAVGGLRSVGEPRGFTVLNGAGEPIPCIYKTTLHGEVARLHFAPGLTLPADTRLAYGHGHSPVCTLLDGRGCALPVFSARPFVKPNGLLPFVISWRVGRVVESPSVSLSELSCPDLDSHGAESRVYGADGFVNERPRWEGRRGQCYFSTHFRLSEPMRLEFRFGYDGPFRCWIDGRPVYIDSAGINPCLPDKGAK
jgi:sialate O-acetylesterase